jgi:hypothetical protein
MDQNNFLSKSENADLLRENLNDIKNSETARNPLDEGKDGCRGFPLSAFCCIPH